MSRDLRRRLDRLTGHRLPPDPLPSWWGRAAATLTDDELANAIAWHEADMPPRLRSPDPATLTDAELDAAIMRAGVGRRGRP
jgi:hypothetical protein